jgi:tRNA pseudouridine55 synthase
MSAAPQRDAWQRVDGVLLLDKPLGSSSSAALQAARAIYRAAKAGHSGTLDPLATGLLPCLFGEATKFGGALLDADKTYWARVELGATTSTGDSEGEVLERRPVSVSRTDVDRVINGFLGPIAQVPPMHSALKRGGRPLYAYARAGQSVARAPRTVVIHELTVDTFRNEHLEVIVRCSKGTYIRVLAEKIGLALGCGAHLAALRRKAVGSFSVTDAITLDELRQLSPAARAAMLQSIDAPLADLPAVHLDELNATRFGHGRAVGGGEGKTGSVRVYYAHSGMFLGVAEASHDGLLHPRRLARTDSMPAREQTSSTPRKSCEGL